MTGKYSKYPFYFVDDLDVEGEETQRRCRVSAIVAKDPYSDKCVILSYKIQDLEKEQGVPMHRLMNIGCLEKLIVENFLEDFDAIVESRHAYMNDGMSLAKDESLAQE